MGNLSKAALLAATMTCAIGAATGAAAADRTFFCKATTAAVGDGDPGSLSGPYVLDIGNQGSCTEVQYATNRNNACNVPAHNKCSTAATQNANFNSAAFWCSRGVPNGSTIRAYAAVSTGAYSAAQTKGVLTNLPAVTQTKCPNGWLANPSNVNGGVTTDGKCKKASGTLSITPLPANGTQLGTYGFSWGNVIWAWGTTANGGAAVTSVITPAACHW
jgi:hypothetical protein